MRTLRSAIGYIRVSTDGQAEEDKFGIEVQKSEILKYADENNYSIIDWKIDECSGIKDNRPEFDKILYGEHVTNPPIEAIIVFKNDRVARDTKLYFYYLYTLEKRNIKLLSTKESFKEGDDFANIYRSLLMFVAEQERRNIALRTSKGRIAKARYGGYSGGRAPYGYKVFNGNLVINEDERALVEFVFKERDNGVNMLTIAKHLRENNFNSRSGGDFTAASVKSILNNEKLYKGYYKYGDMNWIKGVHEPILKDGEEE